MNPNMAENQNNVTPESPVMQTMSTPQPPIPTFQQPVVTMAQPAAIKPKKKRKKMVLGITAVIILLLVILGGGLVFAYASNTDVPVFSALEEKVERVVVSDKSAGQMLTKELAADLDTLGTQNSTSIFGTGSVNTSSKISGSIATGTSANLDFTITGNGRVDQNSSHSNVSQSFAANISTNGVSLDPKLELRTFSQKDQTYPVMYFKLSGLPPLKISSIDLAALDGKWIKADLGALTSAMSTKPVTTDKTSVLTPEQITKLKNLIQSDTVINNFKRMDDRVIGNVRTNCFQVTLDDAALKDLVNQYSENTNGTSTITDLNSHTVIYSCLGRKDKLPYVIKIDFETTPKASGKSTISFEENFTDYGTTVTVDEPKADINLLDMIQQFYLSQSTQQQLTRTTQTTLPY